jgi:PIN domain nuclease of toxin-antitoxin system
MSSESIKEIILLIQNKKIKAGWKNVKDIFDSAYEMNIIINYIKEEHLCTFWNIVPVNNHRDPSDRMIISQAITEKIPLISSDTEFVSYQNQGLEFIFNKK